MKDRIVILGNGPSLKGVDFKIFNSADTFGMNGAYRYFYNTNWWPTYFGCFDDRVIDNHKDDFKRMIEDPNVPIQKYFLRKKISNSTKLVVLWNNSRRIGELSNKFSTFGFGGNTGVNCCQAAVCLGYKKIILIGIECNYVEQVDGSQPIHNEFLMMKYTPKDNPNYFIPDYQQKGDVYNFPKPEIYHKPAWEAFSKFSSDLGIEVLNCSPISKLECFKKSTLEKELL